MALTAAKSLSFLLSLIHPSSSSSSSFIFFWPHIFFFSLTIRWICAGCGVAVHGAEIVLAAPSNVMWQEVSLPPSRSNHQTVGLFFDDPPHTHTHTFFSAS
ncbi:hypothetical protein CHARACLAT_015511 [Characodon lateralis]|uniref:Secreted protein n=1 Tax=Characodon lateralis TaxID=208331 RepID=A0ABU7CXX3_9TELE|nr:hypothetical protein [Characodon lateralis]